MKKNISIILILFITAVFSLSAKQITLAPVLSNPYLLSGSEEKVYLKIGLTGFELEQRENRPPLNLAIVLDRSGSMAGDKLRRAKDAAVMAVNLLDKKDIVSIVLYDDTINVLVPATKVSDKKELISRIQQIQDGGSTAIFAGVSKGAEEVRKFLDKKRVNRIILLSDGLANVGPDSPGAFAELGASLKKEGISVTTIGLGLGYNEDLMATLASKSDGNHAFVAESADLVRVFNYEFGDVLSVVAQEVRVEVTCSGGVIPVQVLGKEAEIGAGKVVSYMNQLYSTQEKYIILELQVPWQQGKNLRDLAEIKVNYTNMESMRQESLTRKVEINYTTSREQQKKNINNQVMADVVMQLATLANARAVRLRDEGKTEEARALLEQNALYLESSAALYGSDDLDLYGELNAEAAESLDDDAWIEQRKEMVSEQYSNMNQQSY